MRTKPADVHFCGVRPQIIAAANPVLCRETLKDLYQFIHRRYIIHLKKDVLGLEPPWTEDPILQSYKFTNVRREHDRETRWVIDNISRNKSLCYNDKLLNTVLFRLFNVHQTAELLSMPIPFSEAAFKDWDPEPYRQIFREALKDNPNRNFFTTAFMTSGQKRYTRKYVPDGVSSESTEMRVLYFMKHLLCSDFLEKLKTAENQQNAFDTIVAFDGIGPFMAYQIFVDMTYIKAFPFSENEFTIAGPGCRSGLNFLFLDKDGMTYEECVFWVRDHIQEQFQKQLGKTLDLHELFWDLPEEDRCLNVMSLENVFCELSKYIKVRAHKGKSRKHYEPGGGK